jgi:hypothetical protein
LKTISVSWLVFVLMIALGGVPDQVLAAEWNVSSGAWDVAANWSPSGVPTLWDATHDDVYIRYGRTAVITNGLSASCNILYLDYNQLGAGHLMLESNSSLAVNGNYTGMHIGRKGASDGYLENNGGNIVLSNYYTYIGYAESGLSARGRLVQTAGSISNVYSGGGICMSVMPATVLGQWISGEDQYISQPADLFLDTAPGAWVQSPRAPARLLVRTHLLATWVGGPICFQAVPWFKTAGLLQLDPVKVTARLPRLAAPTYTPVPVIPRLG